MPYCNSFCEVMTFHFLSLFSSFIMKHILPSQVKDFPRKITSKWSLKKHLTRFIWATSAQHSAVNYPADHIGALTLNMPSKLYIDDNAGPWQYGFSNLPRRETCGVGTSVPHTRGSPKVRSVDVPLISNLHLPLLTSG